MKEKKINIALSSLNSYELNSFRKFLVSPFFNSNATLLDYFDILAKKIKKGDNINELDNETIWKSIYGSKKYSDQKFRKLASDLFKLYENYLVQIELNKDKSLTTSLKLKAYKDKELNRLYPSIIRQVEVSKNLQLDKSSEYYLNQYKTEKYIFSFLSETDRKAMRKEMENTLNIEEISHNLDIFYIAEKLRYYSTLLSWSRSYKIDKKITGIEVILKLAEKKLFQDYPPIAIYLTITKTIKDPEKDEHFYRLKDLIEKHIHLFPEDEARDILEAAISYCVLKVNKGILEFQKEVLDMYKMGLQTDLILNDGKLSPTTYRNISFLALRTGDHEWAQNFIYMYSDNLDQKYRDNAVNFSFARLHMYKKEYSEVISYLSQIIYNDVWYNTNARSLQVTAYYELDEVEALNSLLASFSAYLSREKSFKASRKKPYQNLIKYTKKLMKLKVYEYDKADNLYQEIQETQGIVNKPWLLEKVNGFRRKSVTNN